MSTKPLRSHDSACGRKKKKILFSLSPTPLFILQSILPVIRLYSEIDRKTGRKGEKEGRGEETKNRSDRASGTKHDHQHMKTTRLSLCTRVNKHNHYSSCSLRIMLPVYGVYLLPLSIVLRAHFSSRT